MLIAILLILTLYICWDINYFIRTYFTVVTGRLFQRKFSLNEVTVIYGLGTFQDANIDFRSIRLSRLVRELDFARYHFYDRTGVYFNSRQVGIQSLQSSTFTITEVPVPLFLPYRINTKLVYWDDRSLFFEHDVITLHDQRTRVHLVSRQHAIGSSIENLLKGLVDFKLKRECPDQIKLWLQAMLISSQKLRKQIKNVGTEVE